MKINMFSIIKQYIIKVMIIINKLNPHPLPQNEKGRFVRFRLDLIPQWSIFRKKYRRDDEWQMMGTSLEATKCQLLCTVDFYIDIAYMYRRSISDTEHSSTINLANFKQYICVCVCACVMCVMRVCVWCVCVCESGYVMV